MALEFPAAPRLRTALTLAGEEAARRGHRHVTLEHVFYAVARADENRALLAACGFDVDELVRELDEYLELLKAPRKAGAPKLDEACGAVLDSVADRAFVRGTPGDVEDLIPRIMTVRDSYSAMLIYAAGVTRLDVLRASAQGRRAYDAPIPDAPRLAVRFLNDDVTSMEFVVHVLVEVFELDTQAAQALMLTVHNQGSADVRVLPAADALERVEIVYALAAALKFPLRVLLVAAD